MSAGATIALNPPSTQPPHPAYIPTVQLTASASLGGPANVSFAVVGNGAPPPPIQGGFYFNAGVAPGVAPPGWYGPPPVGGWAGPPPAGGWNTPWVGPVVALAVAQATFAPFTYNTFTALPVFNWQFGGWGYWYFGVWVPLYV